MPEITGYKTLDLIRQELGISKPKAREAIKALNIQPSRYNKDKRVKRYSPRDIQRIRDWLEDPNSSEDDTVEFQLPRRGDEEETSTVPSYGHA
jgi:hypothetical protein